MSAGLSEISQPRSQFASRWAVCDRVYINGDRSIVDDGIFIVSVRPREHTTVSRRKEGYTMDQLTEALSAAIAAPLLPGV